MFCRAARNILVFEPNICKLSDFGLSRRAGSNHVYEVYWYKVFITVIWFADITANSISDH